MTVELKSFIIVSMQLPNIYKLKAINKTKRVEHRELHLYFKNKVRK